MGRALAVMRVAGALAVGRPVAQAPVDLGTPAREGQLALRLGRFRPRRALVSASTTARTIARLIESNGGRPSRQAMLEDVLESLRAFETARYSRNGEVDAATLDSALDRAADVVARLRATTRWPARTAEAFAQTVGRLRGAVWSH